MSVNQVSDSNYYNMTNLDPKTPTVNVTSQIPNIKLADNSAVAPATGTNQNGENSESSKKPFANPESQMRSVISKTNSELHFRGTKCEFKYYDDINRVAIKVLDKETNEVIREIPPEDAIELIQKLWEYAGLLYDEKG